MTKYIPTMTFLILSVVRWSASDEFAISDEFSRAIIDTVGSFINGLDDGSFDGPPFCFLVLNPNPVTRIKRFTFAFGATFQNSGGFLPPLLQMRLELLIRDSFVSIRTRHCICTLPVTKKPLCW